VFEAALALLGDRGAVAPVLLVLEDLHWADASTLDLVVFLAHNLDGRRVLLLATCRPDEPASAARVHRLADGVRRSGSAVLLELGPLARPELAALLAAQDAGCPRRCGRRSSPAPRATRSSPRSCSRRPARTAGSSRAACATC
jgi:hypothetical protein